MSGVDVPCSTYYKANNNDKNNKNMNKMKEIRENASANIL